VALEFGRGQEVGGQRRRVELGRGPVIDVISYSSPIVTFWEYSSLAIIVG
jgi:hypothetical protein